MFHRNGSFHAWFASITLLLLSTEIAITNGELIQRIKKDPFRVCESSNQLSFYSIKQNRQAFSLWHINNPIWQSENACVFRWTRISFSQKQWILFLRVFVFQFECFTHYTKNFTFRGRLYTKQL